MAWHRCCASRSRPRITDRQRQAIAALIRQDWRPEQISDRAEFEGTPAVSHESVCQFVYADKACGGDLWRCLRGQKPYRKQLRLRPRATRPGPGPGRHPSPTFGRERRDRIGHWEADSLHGRRRHGAALSLVGRCSRLTRLGRLPGATAKTAHAVIRRRLKPLAHSVKSLTADNGKEFAAHQKISSDLNAKF